KQQFARWRLEGGAPSSEFKRQADEKGQWGRKKEGGGCEKQRNRSMRRYCRGLKRAGRKNDERLAGHVERRDEAKGRQPSRWQRVFRSGNHEAKAGPKRGSFREPRFSSTD